MSSIVAINAGAIKIKNITSYGTEKNLQIYSNIIVSGNMSIAKNLVVLSTNESINTTTGGMIVHGGLAIKKNLNVGGNINVGENLFYANKDATSIKVGINTNTPRTSFDINTTDAIVLPSGSIAQRPSTSINGMIRYNNEDKMFEGYNDGWSILGGAVSTDKATSVEVEQIPDEDVIRFYTKQQQRMAVFNGTTNAWGIISNSNTPGDVYGYS